VKFREGEPSPYGSCIETTARFPTVWKNSQSSSVVPGDDAELSDMLRETLQTFVKDTLAAYEHSREIAFVEELPKTVTGKIQRSILADDGRERE
jgi:acyl-coenzyme A synthetase/AMP-(fatty) acid ligase